MILVYDQDEHESVDFLDPKQEIFISYLAVILSILSLCGSLFIVLMHMAYPQIRSFAFKLIVYLSFADIFFSIGKIYLIEYIEEFAIEGGDCYLQAFLINFGGLSSFAWTTVISYTVYATVVKNRRNMQVMETEYLKYAYGLPLIISLMYTRSLPLDLFLIRPFLTGDYGPAGGWCWIRLKDQGYTRGVLMYLIFFYIPLWVAVIYNITNYIAVTRFLREYLEHKVDSQMIRRISLYPLILVVCWMIPTINKLYNFFGKKVFLLNLLHVFFSCLQGLLNALAYGMNKGVQSLLLGTLNHYCPCIVNQFCPITRSLDMRHDPADENVRKESTGSIHLKREDELRQELLYYS
jgi:hypothetical protein